MNREPIAQWHHTPPEAAILADHGLPPTSPEPHKVTEMQAYRERRDGE